MAIMVGEWSREAELSLELLRVISPPSTIPCTIRGTLLDILYSPTIGANIISSECTFQLLGDELLIQTDKTFKTLSRKMLEGIGILHIVTVKHKNIDVILDFHVFGFQDFNLMIAHPIEKFLVDALTQGKLDVHLGKETFSVQISRAPQYLAEPSLDFEPIMEVTEILPFD